MALDSVYTDGVIAVKEKAFLKDKILKLCEVSAEEALRVITDCGFGKGAEANSPYEYEKLLEADARDLDAFIRQYSPSPEVTSYLLVSRDFHNLKAFLKAGGFGATAEGMLAPEGLYSREALLNCVNTGEFTPLAKQLKEAGERVYSSFKEEGAEPMTGAEIGALFTRAEFEYLFSRCKNNRFLKKLLVKRVDMLNILTSFRTYNPEYAAANYVSGGKLSFEQLKKLFLPDVEKIIAAFGNSEYLPFIKLCIKSRESKLPCSEAERIYDSLEADFLAENKYELKKEQPFLYYVFRRRAENDNVRILFVCIAAGMDEGLIKKRMRAV